MPWKECCTMDQREEFVLKAMSKVVPFRDLCRDFNISPKTGYKWVERFHQGGLPALCDQSTRPKASPAGLSEDIVCKMVELKNAHPHWGPRKIRILYQRKYRGENLPSESSFKRVLEKAGLVEKRRKRRPASRVGRIQERREATAPNQVWTVDFKGWWYTCDGKRFEPLTIRDAYSRYILCADSLENAKGQTVRERFEQVFTKYGLPQMIRSDNGSPFACSSAVLGLSSLSVWWLSLGIGLDRIDPGRPDQNGSHERMHRDISLEVQALAKGNIEQQQAALYVWKESYNNERPHQALNNQTPSDLYVPSTRPFKATPDKIEYPTGYAERTVNTGGQIRIENIRVFISSALRGCNVGLWKEDDHHIGVWFGKLRLGEINLETESFHGADQAVEMPP
jgi:transposase InsO family protein